MYWMSFIDNSGKQHQRSTGTPDFKLAEKIYHKVRTMVVEDKWLDLDCASRYTYDELLERFMREHAPTVAPSTQRSYRGLRAHLDAFFAGLTLNKIDTNSVLRYVAYRRLKQCRPATRNRELAMLSKMFNMARLWKWCRDNPCSLVKKEREDNEIGQCLSEEQETLLIKECRPYCSGDLADMVLVALHSGIRQGEVLKLTWANVDLATKTFRTFNEKTDQWRTVPMNKTLHEILSRRAQQRDKEKVTSISGFVFVTKAGTPYHRRNMYREFKTACRKAGIPTFRFHDLRHSAGTRLSRAGVDINSIAAFLDHSQLSTTKRYARHNVESLRRVAAVLDAQRSERSGTNG